jgi:hypothetical protein
MVTKGSLQMQLSGFPAANRAAEVKLVNKATGQTITRTPFLDGSLVLRDVDPGEWDVKVTHPNLVATPIFTGRIRVFPQPLPTFVPIPVPPVLFKDTPIRDVPDANLGPVQQAVTAARDTLGPIAAKAPGEVIRAADWNTLVGAVRDLADNLLQLTGLVSPQGHDHPEIAEKIAEVQDNIRNVMESFGKSLLELRREFEAEMLRRLVLNTLDEAQAPEATRTDLLNRVNVLTAKLKADPSVYTNELSLAGNRFLAATNDLISARPELANSDNVKLLQGVSQVYATAGTQTKPDNELKLYGRTSAISGGRLLNLTR